MGKAVCRSFVAAIFLGLLVANPAPSFAVTCSISLVWTAGNYYGSLIDGVTLTSSSSRWDRYQLVTQFDGGDLVYSDFVSGGGNGEGTHEVSVPVIWQTEHTYAYFFHNEGTWFDNGWQMHDWSQNTPIGRVDTRNGSFAIDFGS